MLTFSAAGRGGCETSFTCFSTWNHLFFFLTLTSVISIRLLVSCAEEQKHTHTKISHVKSGMLFSKVQERPKPDTHFLSKTCYLSGALLTPHSQTTLGYIVQQAKCSQSSLQGYQQQTCTKFPPK